METLAELATHSTILEAIQAPIVGLDARGRIRLFNRYCEQLTGWSQAAALGENWLRFVPERAHAAVWQALQRAMTAREPCKCEAPLLTRDGKECLISWRFTMTRDNVANGALIVGTGAVVTGQRQEAETLRRVTAALTSTLDLQQVLDLILELLAEVVDYDSASVMLSDGSNLSVVAGRGFPDMPRVMKLVFTIQENQLFQEIQAAQRPLVMHDAQADARFLSKGGTTYVRGWMGVPLLLKGQVIGVLTVDSRQPGAFSESDAELVQAFANQAAIAIENARLFEAEARRRRESETLRTATQALSATLDLQEVFERILIELRQVVPYDSASVQQRVGDRVVIIGGHGFDNFDKLKGLSFNLDAEDNPNRDVVRTRQPVILNDAPSRYDKFKSERFADLGIRSWMGVPLLFGDQLVGIITLDKREPNFYTPEHARQAMAFAAQAAIAIENARLFATQKALTQRQAALIRLSADLTATLNVQEVCERVVNGLYETLGYSYIGLFLVDKETGERVLIATVGAGETPPLGLRLRPGQGLTELPLLDGQLHYTPDTRATPRYAPGLYGAEVDVPIKLGDEVFGVLAVESTEPGAFEPHDLDLLTAAANQTAVAIQNARRYEKQRQQADELARLHRASETLLFSATADVPTLAQNIVNAVLREFGQANCSLLMPDPATGEIVRVAAAGPYKARVQKKSLTIDGPGLVPRALRTGQIINVPDVRNDPDYIPNWELARSEMAVPLRLGEQITGVLDVQSAELAAFGPVDKRLLTAFAERAALALENARLYAEVQAYADSLQAIAEERRRLLEQVQKHAETLEEEVAARTAEIFAEKEKIEAILKSAADAIVLADAQGTITYVNDAFTTLTGYTPQQVIGRAVFKTLFSGQNSPLVVSEHRQAISQCEFWRGDMFIAHRDGHPIETEVTLVPVRDERRKPAGFTASLRDVSQARALERAKTAFLTNVSHQLRTPVTNLKTYTYLLNKGTPEKQARYAQIVQNEVEKLNHLVQDLIEITELDAGPIVTNWEPIHLGELVKAAATCYQTQAKERGLTITAVVEDPQLPPALGSKHRLTQALNHIVENALRFTQEGEIVIGARLDARDPRELVLWVSDTGPGISVEEQKQLFERFFRGEIAQPGHLLGTGLGLAMAHLIVRAHGGHIKVYSVVGQGSTFEIRLPVMKATLG